MTDLAFRMMLGELMSQAQCSLEHPCDERNEMHVILYGECFHRLGEQQKLRGGSSS